MSLHDQMRLKSETFISSYMRKITFSGSFGVLAYREAAQSTLVRRTRYQHLTIRALLVQPTIHRYGFLPCTLCCVWPLGSVQRGLKMR